jgi:hypothetical protein
MIMLSVKSCVTSSSLEVGSMCKSFFLMASFGLVANQLSSFFSGWCLCNLDNVVYKGGDAENRQEKREAGDEHKELIE